jgi:hypothetical protein
MYSGAQTHEFEHYQIRESVLRRELDRTDATALGAGVLAVGWGQGSGVRGMTEAGIAIMGEASSDSATLAGIGVAGYANNGVGVWGECANAKTGFAGIFMGNVRINGDLELNGAKAAIVPFPDGSVRRLYCVESPESWFEDFGESRLEGGKAEVRIDPDFAAIVHGDYHVFLTPNGESNGLYVSRRTRKSFTVREQGAGKSSVTFSYRIVARRKDIKAARLPKVKPTPAMKRPSPPDVERPKTAAKGAKTPTR